jgi:DNA-binding transcriptional MerR regulator
MADAHDTAYLSIGEVLGLLLEDFPDVTISKIRFLESQGLISPERTASGYRKFYEPDVELLRVILTEQRSNYLPLRVIKDRLETGEIDPTGERLRPNGDSATDSDESNGPNEPVDDLADVPTASVAAHPASRGAALPIATEPAAASETEGRDALEPSPSASSAPPAKVPARLLPGVLLDRTELCSMVGITEDELDQLEGFGIVVPRDDMNPTLYGDDAVAIAEPACEFLRAGVDARHLRNWRTSAERESSLYEQLVTPRFRQRNPESHAEALDQLRRLDTLGGRLREAMMKQALRRHFES